MAYLDHSENTDIRATRVSLISGITRIQENINAGKIFDKANIPSFSDLSDEQNQALLQLLSDMAARLLRTEEKVAEYHSILDAVPYPIHVTDNDMKWTYMNKAFETLLVQNKEISDRNSAYGKPCRTANANICGTSECGIHQLTTTGKNETYFDWHGASCKQTTAPVLDAKGNRVGFVETVQDLTDIMALKSEIENKAAWYESILDAVPYPIHVTDNDMKWTYMNKAFETLLVQNKEISDRNSAYGKPCRTANANICGTSECGIHQLTTTGKNETYFDWHGASCKQTTAPVLDAKGNRVGFVETVQDLTEQMNQIANYQSILDAVPYPIHVTDNDMKWTYMNKAFETLLIENKEINDRDSAYGLACSTANANICKTNQCGIHQLTTTGKNETYFDWHGASCKQTTAPVLDAKGNRVGFVETVQDLTDQISVISYLKKEVDRLTHNLQLLSQGELNLNLEITKSDTYTTEAYNLFVNINDNLGVVKKTLERLVSDVNVLSNAAVEGKLETRADASQHKGQYKVIIEGVNATLDSVISPVKEALRVSKEYSAYNFRARIDRSIKAEGDWIEFREALDNIGMQVSNAVGLINDQLVDLASNAEEATASIEEVSAGAQQIAQNTGKMSENSVQGEDGITQILKAMEDLNITVGEVSRRAEQVSTIATMANTYSRTGGELAHNSELAMAEIQRSSDEVAQIVRDINKQMDEIGKIVRLISDIANQTNLLALNAAIEAARAGEAGRGFAVVAAEVKSLAQDSRQSAENIADMITTLQDKAKKANEAMGKAGEAVETGNDSLSQTVGSFTQIASSIDDITRNATDVASASEEQAASVQEVTASIQEVSELIRKTTREAGDTASATVEASGSIDQISKIVTHVSGIADSVSREMAKFKV